MILGAAQGLADLGKVADVEINEVAEGRRFGAQALGGALALIDVALGLHRPTFSIGFAQEGARRVFAFAPDLDPPVAGFELDDDRHCTRLRCPNFRVRSVCTQIGIQRNSQNTR